LCKKPSFHRAVRHHDIAWFRMVDFWRNLLSLPISFLHSICVIGFKSFRSKHLLLILTLVKTLFLDWKVWIHHLFRNRSKIIWTLLHLLLIIHVLLLANIVHTRILLNVLTVHAYCPPVGGGGLCCCCCCCCCCYCCCCIICCCCGFICCCCYYCCYCCWFYYICCCLCCIIAICCGSKLFVFTLQGKWWVQKRIFTL